MNYKCIPFVRSFLRATSILLVFTAIAAQAAPIDVEVLDTIRNVERAKPLKVKAIHTVKYPTFLVTTEKRVFNGKKEVFDYLTDHLDHCASLSQAMGIDTYEATRKDQHTFYGKDGGHSSGYLRYLDRESSRRVILLEGRHKSVVEVKGVTTLVVNYRNLEEQEDKVEYSMQAWVKVVNPLFAFFSRIFMGSAQQTADKELTRMLSVPVKVTEAIHQEPLRALHYMDSMLESQPEEKRIFSELLARYYGLKR